MAKTRPRRGIPVELSGAQLDEFVFPHLTRGHRGPMPKFPLRKIFYYILKLLYLGCQWKALPIDKDPAGRTESHPTRVYRIFRRWTSDGCLD
jgi:transposase